MLSDFDAQCEAVTTPSHELVRVYREQFKHDEEDTTASLEVVHYRAGPAEFGLGRQYAHSTDPLDRATGACVLGQLGWARQCFHDESVDILIPLLSDPDDTVVASAAYALGHRNDPRALPALIRELESDFTGSWFLEAAEVLAHPDLVSKLVSLRATLNPVDEANFGSNFDDAIAACSARTDH